MRPAPRLPTRLCVSQQTAVILPPEVALRKGVVMIGSRTVRDVLDRLPPTVRAVAFSDSAEPPPEEELRAMESVLEEGCDAVASGRSVSEAVKVVGGGWVVGSLDRSGLVSIAPPILIDRGGLAEVLSARAAEGWIDPIEGVIAGGGTVRILFRPK